MGSPSEGSDRLEARVLGPLRVTLDGAALPLGGPKPRQIVACLLAARGRPLDVSALVDDLWREQPPATAEHVVSTYVSGLRALLGSRLRSGPAGHSLVLERRDTVDAVRLQASVDEAAATLGARPAEALALVNPWHRSEKPYADVSPESALVAQEAERLTELLLRADRLRMEAMLRLGRHEEALPELAALCLGHPYDEELRALRMLALYRSGRQVEALEVFREFRDTLVEDVGLEPSARLADLELRILVQDDGLLLEPPHALPTAVSALVGREALAAATRAGVGSHRLVTLVGAAGVGKTRLALEVARTSLAAFPGGTWWVDLTAATAADEAPGLVRAVLGIADAPGGADPYAAVRAFLSERSTLLVLDNAEHLLPELADVVGDLLAGAPATTVLATSRHPLGVPGEHRVAVDPLAPDEAVRLFHSLAEEAGCADALTGRGDTVAAICERLDRLPLAIELAAVRLGTTSVDRLRDDLERDPVLHGTRLLGVPERQRTLEAAIEWGYELLTEEQRAVLRRLSVFRAPFGLDAALAIATGRRGPPRGVDVVDALVESSMLVVVPAEGRSVRYRLLDTVRAFAGERLEVSGEGEDARLHHAEYHLDLVGEAGWSRLTPEFADWVPRLEAAGADVTAAVEWAWSHLPHARVGAAAPGLFEYWFRRGSPAPALDFGRRLLSGSDRLPPRLEAAGRLCAGFGAAFAGDVETATTGLDIAIDVLRDDPDWRSLVWALLGRGQNATVLGDLSTARRMGEEILRVCDEHDAPLPRAYGLALLGEAEFLGGGDLVAARAHTEAAIPGLRTLRDPAALNLFGLGIAAATCAALGDLDAAERYAVEATALPGPGWRATAFIILGGWVLHARGERDRARAAVVRGVVLAHRMSLEPWARHGLLMLARLAADEERWEEAARLFGAAHPQPPWGLDPRWWAPEQRVREALGPERHEALTSVGAATPLGEWTRRLRSAGPAGRRPAELSVEA